MEVVQVHPEIIERYSSKVCDRSERRLKDNSPHANRRSNFFKSKCCLTWIVQDGDYDSCSVQQRYHKKIERYRCKESEKSPCVSKCTCSKSSFESWNFLIILFHHMNIQCGTLVLSMVLRNHKLHLLREAFNELKQRRPNTISNLSSYYHTKTTTFDASFQLETSVKKVVTMLDTVKAFK